MDDETRQKQKARRAVNYAVVKGEMPRVRTQLCYLCGQTACEYHHYKGYTTEHALHVVPMCESCHHALHSAPSYKGLPKPLVAMYWFMNHYLPAAESNTPS